MAMGEQAVGESPEELLSISTLEDGKGLEIVDRIERRHFTIETRNLLSPSPTEVDSFQFPIDTAVAIEAESLRIPQPTGAIVRNSLGFVVTKLTKGEIEAFPSDYYSCDIPAPIKLYIEFEGSFEIVAGNRDLRIELDEATTLYVGARSHHEHPAASITTTSDPEDLMKAVSFFGSALKTLTCERSYPTLRGHPPTVSLGDDLRIPNVISKPETGIQLEIPMNVRSVFAVSTLAYYLGAELIPGDTYCLHTENGYSYPLGDSGRYFQSNVAKTLKQTFFLDCLTRTEGYFQLNLYELNEIEDDLGLDFASLYSQPLSSQLESYLEVQYDLIEPYLPQWKLNAFVSPEPNNIESLPFLVNDLATIKTPSDRLTGRSGAGSLDEYEEIQIETLSRGMESQSKTTSAISHGIVRLEKSNALEQTWIGDGAPMGASKGMVEAYRNQLGRHPSDNDIDITVVCNAEEMGEESDVVNQTYGARDELPFDISIHKQLSRNELRDVLETETDFLHYIGHIDEGGFECTDGRLDASTIDQTGVSIFFLNACTSYEQGMHLIEAGSIAGVVTLEDVINSGAERVGKSLARLLNSGFPLNSALNLSRTQSIMGGNYLVIGDGTIDMVQPEGYFPALGDIEEASCNWLVSYYTYPTRDKGMGSVVFPLIDDNEEYFLTSGRTKEFHLSESQLNGLFEIGTIPLKYDGNLVWSDEFSFT